MSKSSRFRSFAAHALLFGACLFAFVPAVATLHAQTLDFLSLYSFTGGSDGAFPISALVSDASGNLYGTTKQGGAIGCGTVFELVNNGGGSYSEKTLYSFAAEADGCNPEAGVVLDANGNLFGTAKSGGASSSGVVFELVNEGGGNYTETVLYAFTDQGAGSTPLAPLVLDTQGNLYGTTSTGVSNDGAVFELVNNGGGSYTERTLHAFTGTAIDGGEIASGVTLDIHGNIFGTALAGGANGVGVVYELLNNGGGNYIETTLYSFAGGADGANPYGGVVMDANGNLFGTTTAGGSGNDGTVFEVVNLGGGNYSEKVLHSFAGLTDGRTPYGGVILDGSGNIFGTTQVLGSSANAGIVFELLNSGGTYTEQILHTFTENADGAFPEASLLVDSNGDLFGTALGGGNGGSGVVFELVHLINNDFATLNGNNSFNGNQTVNGSVAATSFSGNGAGLANVTAAGLSCLGCVGNTQLGINYAGSNAQGGDALNALMLGGLAPSAYAIQNSSNSFTGDQSINGSLTTTGSIGVGAPSPSAELDVENGNAIINHGGSINPSTLGVNTLALGLRPDGYNATLSLYANSSEYGFIDYDSASHGKAGFHIGTSTSVGPVITISPAGSVGIGTGFNNANALLEVNGTAQFDNTVTFAPGQTFPGAGNGTITGVTAGRGLTGGGTSGNVPIGLASNACAPGDALTGLPFTCSAFVTGGSSPSFGTVTATSFSGSGSGLTGVTAAGLTGNISESQVTNLTADLANAVSTSEAFATNAVNNAILTANGTFVPLAGGTMTGALNLPTLNATGSVAGASVTASGALTGGSLAIGGGTPITQYISVKQSITLPGIKGGACTTFETAALTGFTPGDADTIALGVPGSMIANLGDHGPAVVMNYQAWETSASQATTITLQVCNLGGNYGGGASGTVRIDIFKH